MFDIPKRPVVNLWVLLAVNSKGNTGLCLRLIEDEDYEVEYLRASLDLLEWLSNAPDWSMSGDLYLFEGLKDELLKIAEEEDLEFLYDKLMEAVFFNGFFELPESCDDSYSQIVAYTALQLNGESFAIEPNKDMQKSLKFLLKGLL